MANKERLSVAECARELAKLGAKKGGQARALALSGEQRSEIARQAAQARWERAKGTLLATHWGKLTLGDVEVECAVLDNGVRILTTKSFNEALGRSPRPNSNSENSMGVAKLPPFLTSERLRPFISQDLWESTNPIEFRVPREGKAGGNLGVGYRAEALPGVCEVYIRAMQAEKLTAHQLPIARRCELIVCGLARVGIIALIDEATGYQDVRAQTALQDILNLYISKRLMPWTSRFPMDFYREIFRLRGWDYPEMNKGKRPGCVGRWTRDFIYARLAPGVIEELEKINPPIAPGRRKTRHHQWLTPDIGHPELDKHLYGVIGLLRGATSWTLFEEMIERAFPRYDLPEALFPKIDPADSEDEME